jgi:hypothetical protein
VAAAARWYELWPSVAAEIAELSLTEAHAVVVERATTVLPASVPVPEKESNVNEMRDEFLSVEDLALKELTDEELHAYWLLQAQATNDLDEKTYSHGVFAVEP